MGRKKKVQPEVVTAEQAFDNLMGDGDMNAFEQALSHEEIAVGEIGVDTQEYDEEYNDEDDDQEDINDEEPVDMSDFNENEEAYESITGGERLNVDDIVAAQLEKEKVFLENSKKESKQEYRQEQINPETDSKLSKEFVTFISNDEEHGLLTRAMAYGLKDSINRLQNPNMETALTEAYELFKVKFQDVFNSHISDVQKVISRALRSVTKDDKYKELTNDQLSDKLIKGMALELVNFEKFSNSVYDNFKEENLFIDWENIKHLAMFKDAASNFPIIMMMEIVGIDKVKVETVKTDHCDTYTIEDSTIVDNKDGKYSFKRGQIIPDIVDITSYKEEKINQQSKPKAETIKPKVTNQNSSNNNTKHNDLGIARNLQKILQSSLSMLEANKAKRNEMMSK